MYGTLNLTLNRCLMVIRTILNLMSPYINIYFKNECIPLCCFLSQLVNLYFLSFCMFRNKYLRRIAGPEPILLSIFVSNLSFLTQALGRKEQNDCLTNWHSFLTAEHPVQLIISLMSFRFRHTKKLMNTNCSWSHSLPQSTNKAYVPMNTTSSFTKPSTYTRNHSLTCNVFLYDRRQLRYKLCSCRHV